MEAAVARDSGATVVAQRAGVVRAQHDAALRAAHQDAMLVCADGWPIAAAGRLLGTLLSGLSYQLGGLALCLATAAAMAGASYLAARRLV